jgi:hypothetical protein
MLNTLSKTNTPMILRNFIRAKLFILFFACEFLTGFSQSTSIDFDYLQVIEAPKGPIGFIGTAANYHIGGGSSYLGIRLNNAAVGSRAGYYTFGYQAGTKFLVSESLSIHPKLMFTTGGGAESNDGSGGFLTTALLLDYAMDQFNLGFGGQYSYVSTGIIQGWSPMVSLSFRQDFSRKPYTVAEAQIFTNAMYSVWNEHNRNTGFVGVGGRLFDNLTYKSVYLTAAVTDLGGYMDVYGGYGLYQDIGKFRALAEINLGTGGGGRAPAGGGVLTGVQGELQWHHKGKFIGLSSGVLKWVDGPFYFGFTGLHTGIDFKYTSTQHENGFLPMNLSIENGIRTYIGASGFSNLGVAFRLYKFGILQLRGESYWAFTDGRGAYAEGLFGLRLQPNIWFIETQVGAGAGGGINLWGAAALAFVNAGFEIPVNEYWDVTGRGIYNVYSSQAFPTYGWQLGMTFNIPFNTQF